MFAVSVVFRDEDGFQRRGELVNPFKIMVEGLRQVAHIENRDEQIAVMTCDGENLDLHHIPLLAVVEMKEVVIA